MATTPSSCFEKIRQIVSTIPMGQVSTYGLIAKVAGYQNSRLTGYALHGNRDPSIPCHRVVFADGSLSPTFSWGGMKRQKKMLTLEGVTFLSNGKVNLSSCLWTPTNHVQSQLT
jgi:methylated-DNA-protein-cysteine methyltransferase-like protein